MSELSDLYQEVILDHARNPRNRRKMDKPCLHAEGYNPLCGDRVTLYVHLDGNTIRDLSFEGSGCAISTASASLLTEVLRGKSSTEARNIFEKFHDLVTGTHSNQKECRGEVISPLLGKLEVFSGVREFPMRVKCATLVWHTLNAALENKEESVTTEE